MEERLQKFVKLVEAGSFTKAAEIMHISQPALTVAIAKLERELGVQLLVREARPLELTDAGKIAYHAGVAQGVVFDNLRTELNDLAGQRPRVALGMIDSVAAVLSAYASPLKNLGNAADVSLFVNDSELLRGAVAVRELDLAIVATNDVAVKNEGVIADELMVLVVAPSERIFKEAELAKGTLTGLISFPAESTTQQAIEKALEDKGVKATTKLQSSSPEVIIHMVVSGEGAAILPYFMVRSHLITRSLSVMSTKGDPFIFSRSLVVASPPAKHYPHSVRAFLEEVTSVLQTAHDEALKAVATSRRSK